MKYKRIIVNRRRQLELVEDDLPNPRPGEVRGKALAAGVSYAAWRPSLPALYPQRR